MSTLVYTCTRVGLKSVNVAFSSFLSISSGNRERSLSCGLSQILEIYSTSVKSRTLNIGQYLVHSERRTTDTSTLIFVA